MSECTKLIAELHAAGYSNRKIAYLLPQHGLSDGISEATVRRWAHGHEPRMNEYAALQRLRNALYEPASEMTQQAICSSTADSSEPGRLCELAPGAALELGARR